MEEDKFIKYCEILDCYKKEEPAHDIEEEMKDDKFFFFAFDCPFEISILMNHLFHIIRNICEKFPTRMNVETEIENIKNNPDVPRYKDYKYGIFVLPDLFTADYNYLKNHFLLKERLIPNEESFNLKYSRPDIPDDVYPFSPKELFHKMLSYAINIYIDNYYPKNKKHLN